MRPTKKRVVTSYKNLSPELIELLKKKYPLGIQDNLIRVDKGAGDFFYAVVLDTEEISYLIKVDVKIDDQFEDDDKDYFNDEIEGADDIIDDSEEEL